MPHETSTDSVGRKSGKFPTFFLPRGDEKVFIEYLASVRLDLFADLSSFFSQMRIGEKSHDVTENSLETYVNLSSNILRLLNASTLESRLVNEHASGFFVAPDGDKNCE